MKESKRIALVTGSTKGIGLAIGELLVSKNFWVILNSRQPFESLANDLQKKIQNNPRLNYYQADVSKEVQVKKLVSDIKNLYGKIDVLINNVGGTIKTPLAFVNEENIQTLFSNNLGSAIYCSKYCIKHMVANHYGRIINIASMAGTHGLQYESVYSSMKAALIGFTKAIAKEYGSKGIVCNVVAPGIIKADSENACNCDKEIEQMIPVKKFGTVQDIAVAVSFLASEEIPYITGQVLEVNGGLYL